MLKWAEKYHPTAEVKCLYYAHGAESEQEEISLLPDYVEVRQMQWLGDTIKPQPKKSDPFAGAIYIPGRNLAFVTLAACQELPDEIWLGVLADENNEQATDKNDKFRNLAMESINYALSPFVDKVNIRFPFAEADFTKLDTVRWALDNGVPKQEIEKTVSCWHAHDGKHCGKCKQCVKRFLVFDAVGLKTDYVVEPMSVPAQVELCDRYVVLVDGGGGNADEIAMSNMIKAYRSKAHD
jgi:7-cyano-7-deazaguanine synthase in queuosine biosynthesis